MQQFSSEEIRIRLQEMGQRARQAGLQLGAMTAAAKVRCLLAMAAAVEGAAATIQTANDQDVERGRAAGLSEAMLDRLALNPKRIAAMAQGLREVAAQNDPVGRVLSEQQRPNGLRIEKITVPMGVVGIIYEARPNVTVDAAGICLKAGNAVILRGGKEALATNKVLADLLNQAGAAAGMPEYAVQLIPFSDREAVKVMLKLSDCIDLIIPRGGESLIRTVVAESTIPVIKHYKGVCHLYAAADCDPEMAIAIIANAKCQRPAACNALETLLVDQQAAARLLPPLLQRLAECGVEVRGDAAVRRAWPVTGEADYEAEYLDLILNIRIVNGVREAVEHINQYGSRHSDGILSNDAEAVAYFFNYVDSSTLYHNASTRFTDGGEFGMGAEIGISTDKLHARGPMGVDELVTYKYLVHGAGQIRE